MAMGRLADRPIAEPKTSEVDYMRLNLRLPEVKPDHFVIPTHCPTAGCKGKRFYPRQKVKKKVGGCQVQASGSLAIPM